MNTRAIFLFFSFVFFSQLSSIACTANNPIVIENLKPGTDSWRLVNPAMNDEISGYASLTSAAAGETIDFFVQTKDEAFSSQAFRLGWYNGKGGRSVTETQRHVSVKQPPPLTLDNSTGLIECPWIKSFSLTVGADWYSGYYVVVLTALDSAKQTYIPFVVRSDTGSATYFVMASTNTWLAYNNYGGKSSYDFNSNNSRSFKVSYNRPYAPTGGVVPLSLDVKVDYGVGASFLLGPRSSWEYIFVRFLEKEGYDVLYFSNMDLHTGYNISPPRFKVGLIVGHDEYWSSEMRTSVEKARSKGLNLAFFGANICFWQVRFESSPTSLKQNRVMIIYKDDYRIQVDYRDPFYNDRLTINDNLVTTRWRWPPVLYNESLLMGVMYTYDPVIDQDLIIHDGSHWMFSNTSLRTGSRIPGLLGYEVDEMFGVSLPNLKLVMESPFTVLETNATKKSHAVIWRTNAGAYTFSTGSIQWAWGLDSFLVSPRDHVVFENNNAKQITRNLLHVFANPPPAGIEPEYGNLFATTSPSTTILESASESASVSVSVSAPESAPPMSDSPSTPSEANLLTTASPSSTSTAATITPFIEEPIATTTKNSSNNSTPTLVSRGSSATPGSNSTDRAFILNNGQDHLSPTPYLFVVFFMYCIFLL